MIKGLDFCTIATKVCLSLDKLCLKYHDSSNSCGNNMTSSNVQIHDSDAPWKTYLVVLEGNVEDKKSKTPTKGSLEKAAAGERKKTTRKSISGGGSVAATAAGSSGKSLADSIVVPAEPVTLSSEWATHGAIAVVSHGTAGGITVIHTEVPRGTQIQPIVTTDGTGASVISLDGSAIPFSLSVAHPVPLSSEASTISLSVPTVSLPVSDGTAVSVSEIPTVSTSCVLEAAASQTILAPVSEGKVPSEAYILQSDSLTVSDEFCGKEKTAAEQQRTADIPLAEPKGALAHDAV